MCLNEHSESPKLVDMTNKIDSIYTKDKKLIRQHNKLTYRKIIISLFVYTIVYSLYSILRDIFEWGTLVVIVLAQSFAFFNYTDSKIFIDLVWYNKDSFITLTYYNFRDKIVTERIEKKELKTIQVKESIKRIKIELIDNRQIKLDYSKKQEIDILNQRLEIKLSTKKSI